jgi:hypothetical protein
MGELVRWEAEPSGRTRRTLLERLVVALPGLARRFAALVMRRPAGSGPRRWILTRVARDGFAANNRSDYGPIVALLHPEIELRMSADDVSRLGVDLEPLYIGSQGYVEASERFKSSFSELHWDVREILDFGGGRFCGVTDMAGRGLGSGIEVGAPLYNLWEFEDGLLRRQWTFWSENAMLQFMDRE